MRGEFWFRGVMTTDTRQRKRRSAGIAALALAGCGPREDIDARLQRGKLEVPFGAVTDTEEGQ